MRKEISYYNQDLCCYSAYEYQYPEGMELLKIFPEAKEIIKMKIKEWTEIKQELLDKEVRPAMEKIKGIKNDFNRWFWTEAYKVLVNPMFTEAVKQLARLERLKLLTTDAKYSKNIVNFEKKKEIAKGTPILSLYPFEKLRRFGSKHTALCPFHEEKTPSFFIYPDNTFHCFGGCGAHGDAIDFVKLLKGYSFKEAVAQMTGVA